MFQLNFDALLFIFKKNTNNTIYISLPAKIDYSTQEIISAFPSTNVQVWGGGAHVL